MARVRAASLPPSYTTSWDVTEQSSIHRPVSRATTDIKLFD
jgi:hypothetical protein